MKKVLVTGVAGFIGSTLARRLIDAKYNVVGVDNFDSNLYPSREKKERVKKLNQFNNFEFFEQNIININQLSKIGKIDLIFHLAALPGQALSWNKTQLYFDVNSCGTYAVLDYAIQNRINKLVYFSTSSVYGNVAIGNEDGVKKPISPYGISKLAAEQMVATFQSENLETTIIRPFSVYGPGQRPDMAIHKFLTAIKNEQTIQIYGDGEQIRDCTFVEDLVNLNMSLIENWQKNEIFNVSGGTSISINEIINICESVVGKKAKITHLPQLRGDQFKTQADCTKASLLLNYKPETAILDGIRKQYAHLFNGEKL